MGQFLGITVKRVARVGAWTGTLKNPTNCLWRWELDRRFNFFNPPFHLNAITYITEISLHVTLSNQSLSRIVLRASKFADIKFIDIVILWVFYTISFGSSLFWHLCDITFHF